MQIKFEAQNGDVIKVQVDYTEAEYEKVVPDILQRMVGLALMAAQSAPLSKIKLKESAAPLVYDYVITATDGRIWTQAVDFADLDNPSMSFAVSPGWKKSEFVPLRPVRDEAEELVRKLGCKELVISWT